MFQTFVKVVRRSRLWKAFKKTRWGQFYISNRWWVRQGYGIPAPNTVKWACLLRSGLAGATWVETGTYLGETTKVLAKHSNQVYTIEPEPSLYANAAQELSVFKNITVIKGLSEEIFPQLLPKIQGSVNFWLDGHYSAGDTHKGPIETPIKEELAEIAKNLHRWEGAVIFIDDVRCFIGGVYGDENNDAIGYYPPLDFLVDWAKQNNLWWGIEFDIFVAKTKNLVPKRYLP